MCGFLFNKKKKKEYTVLMAGLSFSQLKIFNVLFGMNENWKSTTFIFNSFFISILQIAI